MATKTIVNKVKELKEYGCFFFLGGGGGDVKLEEIGIKKIIMKK